MISTLSSFASAISGRRFQLVRSLSVLAALGAMSGALFAQDNANAQDNGAANDRRNRRGQNGQGAQQDAGGGGGRGNFNPEEMQARMLAGLRENMGVTDDAEWKLISDRIVSVNEIRRSTMGGIGGMGGFRGGQGGQGGQGGGGRFGRGGANPEGDALRQAITDKLPDAEVKSRLARLRETRKANEEKLTKAQEDLRAVLSVRQEAILVMAGMLP